MPYRLLALALVLSLLSGSIQAQLQFPGTPLGDFRKMDGSDLIYMLPPLDPLRVQSQMMEQRDGQKKSLKYALVRPMQLSPGSHGAWTTEEGHRIWRVHLISPGAHSLGLMFSEYAVTEGTKVLVYDPEMRHVRGAYTARNNKPSGKFAVRHIPGEEVVVELQVPGHQAGFGELEIGAVSHAYLPMVRSGELKDGRFGLSQACEIDINCEEGDVWKPWHRSVVRIETPEEYCTGVMVNNTAYDGAPLLLTAEHCFYNRTFDDFSIFVFDYESPSCFGGDGSLEMSIAGSEILAVADSVDFCLLRLATAPPDSFRVYYAGWDLIGAHENGTACIHHPEGDVKKISIDHQPPSVPGEKAQVPLVLWDYYFHTYWWVREWDVGSTEGGSSGSPLFNGDRRVIGLLSGGRARCGDSIGYDPVNDRVIYSKKENVDDYFTNIDYAWDYYEDTAASLQYWLDPVNSGDNFIDGYYPASSGPPVVAQGRHFSLFPNPVSGEFRIAAIRQTIHSASFRIYDLTGKLLLEGEDEMPFVFNSVAWEPGVYLVDISTGGIREILRFIVVR